MAAPGELDIGAVVDGKYRLDRVLGRGGMGVVLAATDIRLQRPVAIKALLPDLLDDAESVERFLREGRAVARLTSENTVRVLGVGELPSGRPYMAMEFLVGSDIEAIVQARGRLPPKEAVDYILQALEGLGEAHARGIVHRDLKPANLFVTRHPDRGEIVKLLDFGLAKAPPSTEAALTATAAILGSPAYMSPQQLRRFRAVDARTDIWAVGVSL